MLEAVAGKVLDLFLSKYFEDDDEPHPSEQSTAESNSAPPQRGRTFSGSTNQQPSTSGAGKKRPRTSFRSGLWSGFLSLDDLRLKVAMVNDELRAAGLPIELVHCSIRKVEMTVPWSQWKALVSSSATAERSASAVLVLDGVHVLARVRYAVDEESRKILTVRARAKRRQILKEATADFLNSSSTAAATGSSARKSWKELLKERLQEGILPAVLDRLQLHIRDLHIRLEHDGGQPGGRSSHNNFSGPFALGLVLQSIHVQHDLEGTNGAQKDELEKSQRSDHGSPPTTTLLIHKVAELNRLGIYCTPLEQQQQSTFVPASRVEQKMLHHRSYADIVRALDQTIPRRSVGSAATSSVPQHVYLLQPLDGSLHAAISTTPRSLLEHPAVKVVCTVTDVSFQIRDVQCQQLVQLFYGIQEHTYSLRHRLLRPLVRVCDDPRAWWRYAVTAARRELWMKTKRRNHHCSWNARQRYCDLYERQFTRDPNTPDDAAGPVIATLPPISGGGFTALTEKEREELQEMEDGVRGELTVQEILLYRILVHKRIGWKLGSAVASEMLPPGVTSLANGAAVGTSPTATQSSSWFKRRFQRMVAEEVVEEDEYLRLLEYWREWSSKIEEWSSRDGDLDCGIDGAPVVAVALEIRVKEGHLSLFSPLASTFDQPQLQRLQERFLEFTYNGFGAEFALLGDYDSLVAQISLNDFTAAEIRSNHKLYAVIARGNGKKGGAQNTAELSLAEPLCAVCFTKKSPDYQDFRFGLQCRLRTVVIDLVPDCEWIGRLKLLMQPMPQFQRVQKFWREMNMANINSWASSRLGLFAKAETAVSDHSAFDVDIEVDCPIFRVEIGDSSIMTFDLGRAELKTEKLAGVAKSHLLRTTGWKDHAPETSLIGDDSIASMGGGKTDGSWRSPLRAKKSGSPGDGDTSNADLNAYPSVDVGGSMRMDESVLDFGGENYVAIDRPVNKRTSRFDAMFYDVYNLRVQTGEILILGSDDVTGKLAGALECSASLHRSIIPADHTLCRLKASCAIDCIFLSFSRTQILLLGAAVQRWTKFVSLSTATITPCTDFVLHSERSFLDHLSPQVISGRTSQNHDDISRDESDFDEAEFFDAAEDETCLSDHVSVFLDDDWVADSVSVLENESRSKSPSILRRTRRSSVVSEVSSISEGSVGRKRLHFQDVEGHQLSAENLARLEEEVESDDGAESHVDSFYSAASVSQLMTMACDLEKDIDATNDRIVGLKSAIKDLRHNKGQDDLSQTGKSVGKRSKKHLRVELERAIVESRELKAAFVAIRAQIDTIGMANGSQSGGSLDRHEAFTSLRNAASVIQSIRKEARGVGSFEAEHSMTQGLMRQLFQFSMVVNQIEIHLTELDKWKFDESDASTTVPDCCVFRIISSAAMVHQSVQERKLFATVDTVAFNLYCLANIEEVDDCILIGGIQDSLSKHIFPARFPEYAFSSGPEEKFLKVSFDLRQGGSVSAHATNPLKVARVRLNVGEIEISPRVTSILPLGATIAAIRHLFASKPRRQSIGTSKDNMAIFVKFASYYDVVVRFAAVRIVLAGLGSCGAAFLLSEIGGRAVGSSVDQLFKDKTRVDIRCGNAQAVYLGEHGEAIQIFGKQDVYGSSLVRSRIKLQSVPADCQGGWVLDMPNPSSVDAFPTATFGTKREPSHTRRVANFHVEVKVESIHAIALPSAVFGFLSSCQHLAGIAAKYQQQSKATIVDLEDRGVSKTSLDMMQVRWRVDLSFRNFCIAFHEQQDFGEETSLGKFELSAGLLVTAQASPVLPEGMIINASLTGLSLFCSTDQRVVLHPASLEFCFEGTSIKNPFCPVSEQPQLLLPDCSSWKNWATQSCICRLSDGGTVTHKGFVVTVSVSELVVDVSAPTCVLAARVITGLQAAVPKEVVGKGVEIAPTGSCSSDDKISKDIFVSLNAVTLNIFHGNGKNSQSGLLCSLFVHNIEFSCLQNIITSLRAEAKSCSLVDFSCREGVLGLAITSSGAPCVAFLASSHKRSDKGRLDATIGLKIGQVQTLLLPTLIRSCLTFLNDVESLAASSVSSLTRTNRDPFQTKSTSKTMSEFASLSFSLQLQSLEVILSSKDIPKCIKDHRRETIGVVTLRLKLDASGLLKFLVFDELVKLFKNQLDSDSVEGSKGKAFSFFRLPQPSPGSVNYAVYSEISCSVKRLQLLRTSIAQAADERPCSFSVSPPSEGEQRITNSFGFTMEQQAVCLLTSTADEESGVVLSHSMQLQSDFVDVLIYISQSAGGMNEAVRATVVPIVDLLKQRKQQKRANKGKGFKELVMESSSIISVRSDGVKFTFVPGGATRLTESPIIKFEVAHLAIGLAAVPVKSSVKMGSDTSLDTMSSRLSHHHLVCGGWMNCELSASYHNRRLVAWEPCIEPWTLKGRVGADLVRLSVLPPISTRNILQETANLPQMPMTSPIEAGSKRLRDIGRLLRSPFMAESKAEKDIPNEIGELESLIDMSYLLLHSFQRNPVLLALFRGTSSTVGDSSSLPGSSPKEWLNDFGLPNLKTENFSDISNFPAFVCWLSDDVPLNVNVTGALIENLSEHANTIKERKSNRLVPHWIRNDSGLTIRFQEVLDPGRVDRNERPRKFILSNNSEVPLSLKRSQSQSCDPHRAHIILELGDFEETVGRVNQEDLDTSRGSRSANFSYKISAKVPVDTVGVHRYPIDWNRRQELQGSTRSLGWIIVRVALSEGIKMVSIESPLTLRNTSDIDLLCEVRDHGGLSILWRCVVPKKHDGEIFVSVPADIVPSLNGQSRTFGAVALAKECEVNHEADAPPIGIDVATHISLPPLSSPSSVDKGIIDERNVSLRVLRPRQVRSSAFNRERLKIPLNICSLRVGSSDELISSIPEQRMLVFRSALTIQNHLALPIQVQVRIKQSTPISEINEKSLELHSWIDLGLLNCADTSSWAGATPTDTAEIRVRVMGNAGEPSRQFPSWSSPVTIPSEIIDDDLNRSHTKLGKLKIVDCSNAPLLISIAIWRGRIPQEKVSLQDNMRNFSRKLPIASRIISLFCPFWIVDGSGLDLQYQSKNFVAGQAEPSSGFDQRSCDIDTVSSLGLGELLDARDFVYLPSRISFQVLMLGEEGASQLFVRRRLTREHTTRDSISSWSDPIPLAMDNNAHFDISVPPPPKIHASGAKLLGASDTEEPFALRARSIRAPEALGGSHGTRLIHIVCRFAIVNDLGQEIEILDSSSRFSPIIIPADGRPRPFHFDDSMPLRFRPKEYGWIWSGRFHVKRNIREMTLRLRHGLKGHTAIFSIEFHFQTQSGTCVIVFRPAARAPYRIENHTMFPIQYRQVPRMGENIFWRKYEQPLQNHVILPYHHAEFAWDDPEYGRRTVKLNLADFGELRTNQDRSPLGSFKIDTIVPGSELELLCSDLVGRVIADGPTRVIRILERSAPEAVQEIGHAQLQQKPNEDPAEMSMIISAQFSHGFGLSVIDWQPQELLYIRLAGISVVQKRTEYRDAVALSIRSITADNQLWVTPYPVLLRMSTGSARRRNKHHSAFSLSWSRLLNAGGGLSDFTFLENSLSAVLPSTISIDGNLVDHIIKMARRVKEIGAKKDSADGMTRNELLRMALNLKNKMDDEPPSQLEARKTLADDLYSAVDYMSTVAIAAKLRSRYRPPDVAGSTSLTESTRDEGMFDLLTQQKHKIYIERLRISTIIAEISWNGSLPVASSFPRLLRPALTFEGLPLLLRPYSSSHAFGAAEEHLKAVKAHYFSVWRILDLVVGILSKPTFLVRACVYTWRDTCATALISTATTLASAKKTLESLVQQSEEQKESSSIVSFARRTFTPALQMNCTLLGGASGLLAAGSSFLRYDAAHHRASGGLVRSRNPRLFANVDGNDLLVEYVEGENAGKALLSRVRRGAHLGEGYLYHVEGVHGIKKTSPHTSNEMDKSSLILMLTFERVLLLHGVLDDAFCEVLWEASVGDIVRAEHSQLPQFAFDEVLLWHLSETGDSSSREERFAKSFTTESGGLQTLRCKHIFVPASLVKTLMLKVERLDHGRLC